MANKLEPIYNTGVKFYSSITRRLALGLDPLKIDKDDNPIYVESGAVCFVADEKGNSIFLNNLLFGDGAVASGTTGGNSGSGGGGTYPTEITLSDLVVILKDGKTLTLADYFNSNGAVISESFKVQTTNSEGIVVDAITIDRTGIKIGNDYVITASELALSNAIILESVQSTASETLSAAKAYSDLLLTSVYKVKGSKETYADLEAIVNPENGDVWNVRNSYGSTPAGTNWVYIKEEDGIGYWDALGGSINLSLDDYAKKSDVSTAISTATLSLEGKIAQAKSNLINDNINPLNNSLSEVSQKLNTAIGNITVLTTNVTTNTNNITNIATQLTWQ